MELSAEWIEWVEVYMNDIEMEAFRYYFKDSLEYLADLKKNYFKGVDQSLFYTILEDILRIINKNLPKELKLRKMFLQMQEHTEELAPLLGIELNTFLEFINKMTENSDTKGRTK